MLLRLTWLRPEKVLWRPGVKTIYGNVASLSHSSTINLTPSVSPSSAKGNDRELATERVVCLVSAYWSANRGPSLKSRWHVNEAVGQATQVHERSLYNQSADCTLQEKANKQQSADLWITLQLKPLGWGKENSSKQTKTTIKSNHKIMKLLRLRFVPTRHRYRK